MKRFVQRLLFSLCLVILPGGIPMEAQPSGGTIRVEVLLVKAGNNGSGVDQALKGHAATLQRLFRFNSYTLAARRTVRLTVPGEGSASLPEGQSLSMRVAEAVDPSMKVEIEWRRGTQRLLQTRMDLGSGNPAVLGGPRDKDGTWLLILQRR